MADIETRVLTRLLMSFSRPESGDGENLSAAEMLTMLDVTHEFPEINGKLEALFKTTHAIAAKLEANPSLQLNDAEQKMVLQFFSVVEKSIAFQKGELAELSFKTLKGLEDIA
jgi:hypothetical protein